MNRSNKGAIEAEIANAITRFQREQQGRGAANVQAHLLGDLVIVRCTGIFTPTEARLSASEEGRRLIKSSRYELRTINHAEIERIIAEITSCEVLYSFYDVNVQVAEQMEVYQLSVDVEKKLLRADLNQLQGMGAKS